MRTIIAIKTIKINTIILVKEMGGRENMIINTIMHIKIIIKNMAHIQIHRKSTKKEIV
jgi:hypothetical protein